MARNYKNINADNVSIGELVIRNKVLPYIGIKSENIGIVLKIILNGYNEKLFFIFWFCIRERSFIHEIYIDKL